jgi:DMSO/TMAO reductase YedYZ molybdopterin-dependent catalytic subunit
MAGGPSTEEPAGRRGHARGRRVALIAGLAGSAAVTGGLAVLHTFRSSAPFLPLSLAQSLVRAAPGGFATFFIERLGHWALRLAVVGTFAAFLAAGAVFGLLIPTMKRGGRNVALAVGALSFVPFWFVSIALYPLDPDAPTRGWIALATLPIYLLGGMVAGRVYERLTAVAPNQATDLSRRYLLRALWFGALAVLVGVADLGRLLHRRPDPGAQVLRLAQLRPAVTPPAATGDNAFRSIPGLSPSVTPNQLFYVVDEEIIDPDLDPATWRLAIGGLVERPFQLTYDGLTSMSAVERYQTLECISNPVGGGLISNARWEGVPLPAVLERAGPRTGSAEVVFRCAGGYSESLSIDRAMAEDTLLAIGMNGNVLPRAHGFPVRLLSTGTYGMKNPKWLTSIEVVDRPYLGYWEQRGWSKQAIVKTWSRIDVPPRGADVSGTALIAGIAFAGEQTIMGVEVSTDGGSTWQTAQLETALSSLTWRRWLYRWTVEGSGDSGVLVRATDGLGLVQTAAVSRPHPDGASGYDAITVNRGS